MIIHGRDFQHRARLRAELLPGHDVGVMLEPGDDDLVALPMFWRPQLCATRLMASVAPRTNTISSEDDASKKAAHLLARGLIGVGRARGEFMRAAMHVRVFVAVEVREPVDDGLRLLRGGGVVEPDQRVAVDLLVEDRKVAAHGIDVVARLRG